MIRTKWKRMLLLGAISTGLGGLLWYANRELPYMIQGRSLKEWIVLANTGQATAREIMRNLGPETVPPLTALLREGPSPLRRIYLGLWLKAPGTVRQKIPAPEYDLRPDVLQYLGQHGPAANSAVPAIIEYLHETQDYTIGRFLCLETLASIGPGAREAIPHLLPRLEAATDEQAVALICQALACIATNEDSIVSSRLAALARGTNAPLLRINYAMASHAIRPDLKLVEEVVAPLFAQWKRAIQIDEDRGHTARMNIANAAEIIARFEGEGGPGRKIARQTADEIGDRRLQRKVASALEIKHSEPALN